MSDFILAVDKVEIADVGTAPNVDLGKTKGGVVFRQNAAQEVEIDNDQDVEPEAIITTKLRREMEINLSDCKLDNLALVFNGTVAGSVLSLPTEVSAGVTKAVKLTTKAIGGVYYEVLLPKARIKPDGEITVNNDGNAVVRLLLVNLAHTSAPTITRVSS